MRLATRRSALVFIAFIAQALQGCKAKAPPVPTPKFPIVSRTSADFGLIQSGSVSISRTTVLQNLSEAEVHISRWVVSCDCLSIEPASFKIAAGKSENIRLTFDPTKEGDGFAGDLRISVDGFDNDVQVASFEVPVTVVTGEK